MFRHVIDYIKKRFVIRINEKHLYISMIIINESISHCTKEDIERFYLYTGQRQYSILNVGNDNRDGKTKCKIAEGVRW